MAENDFSALIFSTIEIYYMGYFTQSCMALLLLNQ